MSEVRPRKGTLIREDGERIPLRFVPTEDADTFLAVTVDGEAVTLGTGDAITVDMLGPGQAVTFGAPE
jgi:hypothetical protein